MTLLPDYNPEGRCPKCLYDTVTTRYLPSRPPDGYLEMMMAGRKIRAMDPSSGRIYYEPDEPLVMLPECLRRTCVRCGHTWDENVVGVHEIHVKTEAE